MISFVIPAHNEEGCLGETLQAIHQAVRGVAEPYEVIVVNDASTDATAQVAARENAVVVTIDRRQIAAARNAGARAASGQTLFFVDADTIVNARVVASALRCIGEGAVGGGCPAKFDRSAPLYARLLLFVLGFVMRLLGLCGGAFMFCTREAFDATGGFDERLFGAEDTAFSWALTRKGRFKILWLYVTTSGRRMRGWRGLKMLQTLVRAAFSPRLLRERSQVRKVWYESDRSEDKTGGDAFGPRVLNAVLLVVVIAWIFPWGLIPASTTPRGSVLGQVRIGCAILSCHIAMVCWPCAYLLFRSLLRQPRWIERLRLTALMAVCLWCGWGAMQVVVWSWTSAYDYLVH